MRKATRNSAKTTLLFGTSALVMAGAALAAPSAWYSFDDSGVFEDFDSMGEFGTSAPGEYWEVLVGGVDLTDSLTVPTGGATTAAFNGGGWAGSAFTEPASDRALGVIADTAGLDRSITMRLRNDTGAPLTHINVLWDLERWIEHDSTSRGGFRLQYSTNGTRWRTAPNRTFRGRLRANGDSGPNGWSDGNTRSQRDIGGILEFRNSVDDGADFYLRWEGGRISRNRNADIGLAIDNVRVDVVPAYLIPGPGVAAVCAFGFVMTPGRRRA